MKNENYVNRIPSVSWLFLSESLGRIAFFNRLGTWYAIGHGKYFMGAKEGKKFLDRWKTLTGL